ncbi:MAG: helix-turn-helix domain-containing protein [Candidatus Woesearchaeota archaeon]
MEQIFQELQQGFDLSDKHILILEALYKKDLGASETCSETKIPKGRVYSYLNDLLRLQLIEKSEKKPYLYSMRESNNKIMNFLNYKFDSMVEKQKKIMDLLEKKSTIDNVEIIQSGDDFIFNLLKLIKEGKVFRSIVHHRSIPFALYPSNLKDFQKVREVITKNRPTYAHTTKQMASIIYKSYTDAFRNKKRFFEILEKESLEYNLNIIKKELGAQFLKEMINDLKKKLENNRINIYVVDEYIPMHVFLTKNKVFLSLMHLGVTTGTIIRSDRIVTLYKEFFEDMLERSKPIVFYLNKMKI